MKGQRWSACSLATPSFARVSFPGSLDTYRRQSENETKNNLVPILLVLLPGHSGNETWLSWRPRCAIKRALAVSVQSVCSQCAVSVQCVCAVTVSVGYQRTSLRDGGKPGFTCSGTYAVGVRYEQHKLQITTNLKINVSEYIPPWLFFFISQMVGVWCIMEVLGCTLHHLCMTTPLKEGYCITCYLGNTTVQHNEVSRVFNRVWASTSWHLYMRTLHAWKNNCVIHKVFLCLPVAACTKLHVPKWVWLQVPVTSQAVESYSDDVV